MIAIVNGSPSVPARTTDCGEPPTATQIGSGSCTGRGHTPASLERRAMAPGPRHARLLAKLQQQLELLGVQLVVVVEVVAEQREGLDERAASGHDLRAPVRQQVDLGEVLEDAHGVGGAEDGDGARKTDALGPHRRGAQHDGRRGDEEVRAVMLADAEHVEPELIRELDLLHQLAHALARADAACEVRERG